jgi:hypothetical protein
MTIIIERLALVLILIAIAVNFYFDKQAFDRDVVAAKQLEEWNMGLTMRIVNNDMRIDSIKTTTLNVAKATMYLDSCQQVKTTKSDRAERRGKFVGGLLRGLFPGM